MHRVWRPLKSSAATLTTKIGRAGAILAGPYRAQPLAPEGKGAFATTIERAGLYEWRLATQANGVVTIHDEHSELARAPIRQGQASGLVEVSRDGAQLRIEIEDASSPPSFHLRRVGRRALAAHVLALQANRRAILTRWRNDGFAAALDALKTARRGETVEDYHAWIAANETPQQTREAIAAWLKTITDPPLISVVTPAYATRPDWLHACLASVRGQIYPHWEHCVVDDCSPTDETFALLQQAAATEPRLRVARREANGGIAAATNDAIALAKGAWIAFLDHDDTLSVDALALASAAIAARPDARIIYTDEDKIDDQGVRSDPRMKGGWNPALFGSQNYLNHLTLIRRDLIEQAGGLRAAFDGSQDYDLLLRCIALIRPDQIVHIPAVAYHWRFGRGGANFSVQQAQATQARLSAAYAATFTTGAISAPADDGLPYPRLRPATPNTPPLVSIIIPTRDHASLLQQCIETLTARAGWPNFEFIVMDNDSVEADALALLDKLKREGAQVARHPGPFNFSAINNAGAGLARGEILAFVNNDIEAKSPNWLAELANWFSEPDIAAVGPKLLYPDQRVQHAGLVTGIGGSAGHLYKYREASDPGPFALLARARDVSALTAACLLVRADAFRAVGGFDEVAFPIAFNDVDLCLKLGAAGHRLIWTPDSVLVHHESASRGADTDPSKRARFEAERNRLRERWGDKLDNDPHYSPNLTLSDESSALALPSRYRRPWVQ